MCCHGEDLYSKPTLMLIFEVVARHRLETDLPLLVASRRKPRTPVCFEIGEEEVSAIKRG